MYNSGLMVSTSDFGSIFFQNIYLLFNSDIVDFLFKINERRNRRPKFVIFVVWSALIVVGWWWCRAETGGVRPLKLHVLF